MEISGSPKWWQTKLVEILLGSLVVYEVGGRWKRSFQRKESLFAGVWWLGDEGVADIPISI